MNLFEWLLWLGVIELPPDPEPSDSTVAILCD